MLKSIVHPRRFPRMAVSLTLVIAICLLTAPYPLGAELPCPDYELQTSTVNTERGIFLYKRNPQAGETEAHYILEIDLTRTDVVPLVGPVRRENPCCPLEQQDCQPSPDCPFLGSFGGSNPEFWSQAIEDFRLQEGAIPSAIVNGNFFGQWGPSYSYGQFAFPLEVGDDLIAEGYADPSGPRGEAPTPDHRVLCLDNEHHTVQILPYYRIDQIDPPACAGLDSFEMVGFSTAIFKSDGGRTVLGVSSQHEGGPIDTLLVYSTKSNSVTASDRELRRCGASETMQLDGGGSSQLRVFEQDLVDSTRPVPNAFGFQPRAALFSDVPDNDWFAPFVGRAHEQGIFEGFADNTFRGAQKTTRAEALKVAYVSAQEPVEPLLEPPGFEDVHPEDWFYGYVADAKAKGFVNGRQCGTNAETCFFPNEPVTRAEALKILSALYGIDSENYTDFVNVPDSEIPPFPDVSKGDWFYPYVHWMAHAVLTAESLPPETERGEPLVSGYPSGMFEPARLVNRAELAKISIGLQQYFSSGSSPSPTPRRAVVQRLLPKATAPPSWIGRSYEQIIDRADPNAPTPLELAGGNQQIVTAPIELSGDSVDADGDELSYFWTADGGTFTTSDPNRFSRVTWWPPAVASDTTFTIRVVRGDGRGLVGRGTLQMTVPGTANAGASGSFTSPSGTQTGPVSVTASASDPDGLQRVSVTFVPAGTPLVLCGAGGPAACVGTSGSFSAPDVDPTAYGAVAGPVTLSLTVEDSTGASEVVATRSFTYDPPTPGSGFTLTVIKEGDGDGTVSGGGIDCPPGCTSDSVVIPEGTAVTLTGSGDQFIGFNGETCFGTAPCDFGMYRDREIHAAFALPESFGVAYTTPASGDTGIGRSTYPEIFFNREVFAGPALAAIAFEQCDGTPVPFNPVVRSAERRLTLVRDTSLAYGGCYVVNIPVGAVEDAEGTSLSAPYSFTFRAETEDQPKMYLSAYPTQVIEGSKTKVSIWFETPSDEARTIMLTSGPAGQLLHPSSVILEAGDVLYELDVDTVINHGSLADFTETLQASEATAGTVSIQITVRNLTPQSGSSLIWQTSSIIAEEDGDGVFEAGEFADIRFYVANTGSSDISNVALDFRVVDTYKLFILGGKPYHCDIGYLARGKGASCTETIKADVELPSGTYWIEVTGSSSQGGFLDFARVRVVNNAPPDFYSSLRSITSADLQPGTVINLVYTARNVDDGFSLELPRFEVVIEIDGQEQLLYDTYADARGDFLGSQSFRLPIVVPPVPGAHPIRVRINPDGPDHIPEATTANNEAEVILYVASPNRPPVLDPVPERLLVDVGETLDFTVTASDADGDPLTYSLGPGAPAGLSISATTGSLTWTPACGQGPQSYNDIQVIVEDPAGASDSASFSIDVGLKADLAVTKTASSTLATPGEVIGFTITVTNQGPSCVTAATVSDVFSPELADVTWSCAASADSSCTISGSGDIGDSAVDLLASGTATYQVTARIDDTASGQITNQATVAGPAGAPDPVSTNNTATVSITLRELDFGDAADSSVDPGFSYPVTLTANGARHGVDPALRLGDGIDGEADGQSTLTANGDDLLGADDEDGVVFESDLVPCATTQLTVSASAAGLLSGWIDFDRDGTWDQVSEAVVTDQMLAPGANPVMVTTPCGASVGATYARFRLSSAGGLGPAGLALDGEVEDEYVVISPALHTLTVEITGAGSGEVLILPGGTTCGSSCTETFPESTEVSLTANATAGSSFTGWSGAGCTGTDSCLLTLDGDRTVTAPFEISEPCYALALSKVGQGSDPVPSPGSSTGCDPGFYHAGEIIELTAEPSAGWVVTGWTGTDNDASTATLNTVTQPAADHAASVLYSESTVPSILLVDDDDNDPDVLAYYTAALDALGESYDVWDTDNSDIEPEAEVLQLYSKVLWFTGAAFRGFAGPGPAGESALASFLDAGGCLVVSSQDYMTDRGITDFMTDYLGVSSGINDAKHTEVTGTGPFFGGTSSTALGPYPLVFSPEGPLDNFSDLLTPASGAAVAFQGDGGEAAVETTGATYRSLFLGFPFEALPSLDTRTRVLKSVLDFCHMECSAPFQVHLSNDLVTDARVVNACDRIVADQGYAVLPGGDLTLRAPGTVVFGDGFEVQEGGTLRVVIERP